MRLPGRFVFDLETTRGLPLEVIKDLMREDGHTVNVVAYAKAAVEAKWTVARTHERLRRLGVAEEDVTMVMALAYGTTTPPLTDEQERTLWEEP